jgi:hypothetical protein
MILRLRGKVWVDMVDFDLSCGTEKDSTTPKGAFCAFVDQKKLAGATRLELATSCVTGRRSNQTELRPQKKQAPRR